MDDTTRNTIPEPYAPTDDGEYVVEVVVRTSEGREITLSDPIDREKMGRLPDLVEFANVEVSQIA